MSTLRRYWVFALIPLATACAPIKIESNKAAAYTTVPTRIVLVTDLGTDFGADYAIAFMETFSKGAADCGITLLQSTSSWLGMNDKTQQEAIRTFGPDAVLTMRRTADSVVDRDKNVVIAAYDFGLVDQKSRKLVWRAQTRVARPYPQEMTREGQEFAVYVVSKMKQDELFGTCRKMAKS